MKSVFYAFLVSTGLVVLSPVAVEAQFNLGIATSNWSGTNALIINPATIADSREKFTIDIISANAGADNNLGTLSSISGISKAINNGNLNNLFTYSNSKTFSLLAPYAKVTLPGFMWSINKNNSIALTSSVNVMNQFNNFDQSLFRTVGDPNYVINGDGVTALTSKNFNYTAHLWTQTGVTYAGVLLDRNEHEIRIGATLRYLRGIGYIGLKGNNLDVFYKSGVDSVHVTNSDMQFASNILTTQNAILNGTNSNVLNQVFTNAAGMGMGGDLGITYDYMPEFSREKYDMNGLEGLTDYSRNRYMLRFSAAVMDLGSINYGANNNSNASVTGNGYITGKGLADSVKNYNDFRNYAVQHGFRADTSHQATRVYMPTTLRLSVDYNIYRHFYINAMYISNLANRMNFGNSYYNQFTITPRFDRRMLSVGLPITYSSLSGTYKVGVGVRYSGFFIGSDDMAALVANNQNGVNVYVGGFVPFYKLKKKDRDGDGISDDRDECPDAYGTFENKGCPDEPDMDHGGSADTSDNCPDLPQARRAATKTSNNSKAVSDNNSERTSPADDRRLNAELAGND